MIIWMLCLYYETLQCINDSDSSSSLLFSSFDSILCILHGRNGYHITSIVRKVIPIGGTRAVDGYREEKEMETHRETPSLHSSFHHPRGSTCLEYTEPHTSTDYENRGALEGEELRLEPTNQIPPHGTVWAPNVPSSIKGRGEAESLHFGENGHEGRMALWISLASQSGLAVSPSRDKTKTQDKSFSRHKAKAGITIKVKTSQDFVDDS